MGDIMKKQVSVILCFALSVSFFCIFTVYGNSSEKENCIELLNSLGWQVEKTPTDTQKITIPAIFDNVYQNYNELQKTSGFDLSPYCGKSGTRYTFIVTNYPLDTGETVYANVITVDGKVIGGDIMTVSLSGFMHGLKEHTP